MTKWPHPVKIDLQAGAILNYALMTYPSRVVLELLQNYSVAALGTISTM